MKTFKQYIEGLSSHGGFPFTARTGNPDAWKYGDSMVLGMDQEKQQKDLINLYRNSISKMEERLIKLPKHNFHIYYGAPNNELLKGISVGGLSRDLDTEQQQKDALNKLFFVDMGIPKTDIVFLKAQHTGDPLTAWMTFHTLAHGLVNTANSASEQRYIFNLGMELLNNLVRESMKNKNSSMRKYASDEGGFDINNDIYDMFLKSDDIMQHRLQQLEKQSFDEERDRLANILNDRAKIDEVFGCIYPFRSARAPRNNEEKFARINSKSEITYELMASYLWNGGNIPRPKRNCLEKIAAFFILSEEDTFNIIDRKFHEIESTMEKLLNDAAGKVIVD